MVRSFPRAGVLRRGYRRRDVDRFFASATRSYEESARGTTRVDDASIRSVAFPLARGGYRVSAVDAGLDKLEEAFVRRRRNQALRRGDGAWDARTRDLAAALTPRLERPRGERFALARGRGYALGDVDTLLDSLAETLDGDGSLSAADVRGAVFSRARGRRAYDERVVDAYLDRAVEALLARA